MTIALPPALAAWHEAPRVRPLNDRPIGHDGRYVLCWLQQALRALDNPVIDAAILLANALRLPVLVFVARWQAASGPRRDARIRARLRGECRLSGAAGADRFR